MTTVRFVSEVWKLIINELNVRPANSGFMLTVWILKSMSTTCKQTITRMWANAQRDGRPAACRWRPLFNAAKFG